MTIAKAPGYAMPPLNFSPRLVRGVNLTTERDMWQSEKHYRFRSGKYYGRVRYVELNHG
ncbi:hypothetical protein SM14VA2_13850 [Serratia marcescens]|nr:hypothetical protein SM14VA2_13850 [Serratia marcescens]